jgi:hypothetical protein
VPNPNLKRAAGALGARRRWHPGSSEDELLADLERARIDQQIDELVASAGRMTPDQAARVGRLFRYAAPRDPGTDAG